MPWVLPLSLLIVFELIADIFAKSWSLRGGPTYAILAISCYVLANTFWLFALRNGAGLAKGAVIFSVASAVLAILVGIVLYKEALTRLQIMGIVLGLISICLIFWRD